MHSLQIREGEKGIFDVLNWYNEIINFVLDYISLSIHDSDVSDFYRYIIGFKNLLRQGRDFAEAGIKKILKNTECRGWNIEDEFGGFFKEKITFTQNTNVKDILDIMYCSIFLETGL